MKAYQSLSDTRWDCKYHIVLIRNIRKRMIFGALRKHLGAMFKDLANLASHKKSQVRGYCVSTAGLDGDMVRAYIRTQEKDDERYDQMKLSM